MDSQKSKIEYLMNIINSSSSSSSSTQEIFTNTSDMVSSLSSTDSSWIPHKSEIAENTEYISDTTELQRDTELVILDEYSNNPDLNFNKDAHLKFIINSFSRKMPGAYRVLDANHTWMTYWLLNSYYLINSDPIDKITNDLIVNKVQECIVDDGRGGIAGGSNQLGHVASTYAGILTLALTKQFELLDSIRLNLYDWLMSLKLPNGSFLMHEQGESDTRSTYCVLIIANLLNIATEELLEGVEDWIDMCQTYEGGFSNVPNTEAHGGYTFCAVASYFLLHSKFPVSNQKEDDLKFNLDFLTSWCIQRQHGLEGGLDGRTNKLVDACYSFWVGALFPLVELLNESTTPLFNREALEHYILRIAQEDNGGFKDKPGKNVDFYHTNYSLAGLSILEHTYTLNNDSVKPLAFQLEVKIDKDENTFTNPVHPVFGIPMNFVQECKQVFASKSLTRE